MWMHTRSRLCSSLKVLAIGPQLPLRLSVASRVLVGGKVDCTSAGSTAAGSTPAVICAFAAGTGLHWSGACT